MTLALLEEHCALEIPAQQLLKRCIDVLGMSTHGSSRIFNVARTIADLETTNTISEAHVAEAVGYRQISS